MEKKLKVTQPKYHQIATDIASKIVAKQYEVGDKIYARSSIASQYGVSSETARRAICILSDLNIVETEKGSGVVIKSYENAIDFVRQYKDIQSVNQLKKDILDSVARQAKEFEYLNECLSNLIERTDRFRSINPFVPFEVEITSSTPYLNQSISELNFWHNTSATIIAIKREDSILLSPGPYAELHEKDVLYFVGEEPCFERVKRFLYLDEY